MTEEQTRLEQLVLARVMRLNATVLGIVVGLTAGMGLFIATNWLILRGGPITPEGDPLIGPNLILLNQFFVGFDMTFVGSLIGFAYAFVCGFSIGFVCALIYNRIVALREK